MYKTENTTYVVRNIPVVLWKKCKSKFLLHNRGERTMGEVIIKLLKQWERGVNSDGK
jgi:hypothetical protein